MIKIKIQKVKEEQLIFKISLKENDIERYPLLKRPIIEGKQIKGRFNYEVPLRYFVPIINNINKEDFIIDKNSKLEFLEFFDNFEERHYASLSATPKFMKTWRNEDCPNIFKIKINPENKNLSKQLAFKKIKIKID
ncbi:MULTISPECIES: hypothetical protein [Clostridium]|uniref:Uncharacterized protein n=1 Tax=bioreactor metagenome TaxID=1076179 RepID=A0A644W1V0_9ZZZZ|nr:hypothetical protein [Clostridium sp. C8]KLE16490.1 hypothetical protein AAT22_06560 [Clostridium sp. C8]